MFLANLATYALSHVPSAAAWIFQESTVGWDPVSLWRQMGILAKITVIILFIMSGWSIGVMIDRAMAFRPPVSQSRAFAPAVAGALREGKIDEAIKVADRNKKSHLAKVVTAGLQEFKAHGDSADMPGEQIDASKRALERAEAIVHAELKRGSTVWPPSVPPLPSWAVRHRGRHSERL
jgi:biopolymer transport protein ExbB